MLSRVANNLYWMARYIERAENLARLIDVNLQLRIDTRAPGAEAERQFWMPLILSTGDESRFSDLYPTPNLRTVTEFLSVNEKNPNGIRPSIAQARENARMVRDQITDELWEEINSLHLFLKGSQAESMRIHAPEDYYRRVLHSSYLIQGLIGATHERGETWQFLQLGRFLERADKTTRILDIEAYSETEQPEALRSLQAAAVLRSCSAYTAYRNRMQAEAEPAEVARFLLFAQSFPRSVAFCAQQIDDALHRISGSAPGSVTNEAERLSGRVMADMTYGRLEDVLAVGLHEYLDQIQRKFNEIGEALFKEFILYTPPTLEESIAYQIQQQIQQ
ncbi:MAG: alpha-E domain-containing protein [Verrucomicrobiales bacterium]